MITFCINTPCTEHKLDYFCIISFFKTRAILSTLITFDPKGLFFFIIIYGFLNMGRQKRTNYKKFLLV